MCAPKSPSLGYSHELGQALGLALALASAGLTVESGIWGLGTCAGPLTAPRPSLVLGCRQASVPMGNGTGSPARDEYEHPSSQLEMLFTSHLAPPPPPPPTLALATPTATHLLHRVTSILLHHILLPYLTVAAPALLLLQGFADCRPSHSSFSGFSSGQLSQCFAFSPTERLLPRPTSSTLQTLADPLYQTHPTNKFE